MIARDFRRPSRAGRLALAGLLGTSVLAGLATAAGDAPAWAAAADEDLVDITGLTPVGDRSLDDLRGGFSIGPFNVNFGVMIKTSINQMPVLQTSFVVTKLGQIDNLKQNVSAGFDPSNLGFGQNGGASGQNGAQNSSNTGQNQAAPVPEAVTQTVASVLPETPPAEPLAVVESVVPDLPAVQVPPVEPQAVVETVVPDLPPVVDPLPAAGTPVDSMQDVIEQMSYVLNTTPTEPAPEDVPQEVASLLGGPAGNDAGTQQLGNNQDPPAPQDLVQSFSVTNLDNGVNISNGMGTEIMQQIQGGILTQSVNSANGMDISHATELILVISNFTQVVCQA
ncbi:MAG: hypothetical protein AB7H93_25730, partial [Vicinamibacterales bacterium]